ncbi:Uncharacterized protein pbN1_25810 [Aromatoleum bremense]|nr:Uncharacterized protein pbN1_25810 [Aromatoleum bremense]
MRLGTGSTRYSNGLNRKSYCNSRRDKAVTLGLRGTPSPNSPVSLSPMRVACGSQQSLHRCCSG